ncbi:MAG TPA: alpha/beta hydrolase [Solirubrobacteraceae bacterium]|jgi:pimeloyl-ACP methyl ester carboxylesterase|nr:alpha/beta hydrolase [Solirubrobacteraceae bacterium]
MFAQEREAGGALEAPVWGELRYGGELVRLLSDARLRAPGRCEDASPVMLIPGFMAGDNSLRVMRHWLRRRGHCVAMSGMRVNIGCAEAIVQRLQVQLEAFAAERGGPVVLIGQSRGGVLARALAVRHPELVCGLVMLGSPVCDGLAVSPSVLRTVRLVARLGDLGVPGVFSSSCKDGECCAAFAADLAAPLADDIEAVAVYSRSDGIVDWRACLDPYAELAEVDSSHCGMSVHPQVYRVLEQTLDGATEAAWSG